MTFKTSREILASPEEIYNAISQPQRLAKWWGPEGFTNTFHLCEFKSGGRWSFIMHGPDGHDYPNESIFTEIEPCKKVVIQHVNEPKFFLTIDLLPTENGTLLSWSQAFESSEIAERVKSIVIPANEQNLDRLSAEVFQ